jgi:hypothetical protein
MLKTRLYRFAHTCSRYQKICFGLAFFTLISALLLILAVGKAIEPAEILLITGIVLLSIVPLGFCVAYDFNSFMNRHYSVNDPGE